MVRAAARATAAGWAGEICDQGKDGAADGCRVDDLVAPGTMELSGGITGGVVAARDAPIQRHDLRADDGTL